AADDAAGQALAAAERAGAAREEVPVARARRDAAAAAVATALAAVREADTRLSEVAREQSAAAAEARGSAEEVERLKRARSALEETSARDRAALASLVERMRVVESSPAPDPETQAPAGEREWLEVACAEARTEETDAQLAVRTAEERLQAVSGQAADLEKAADQERATRTELARLREGRARGASHASDVADLAVQAAELAKGSREQAAAARDAARARGTVREGELLAVRAANRALAEELAVLRDAAHRDEVVRAEFRLRLEGLTARAMEEFGLPAAELVAQYGPDQLVPADEDGDTPVPYDRGAQERRAVSGERALAALGKVNALALEEYAALEERHAFLATQLEDLKATRRDLLGIVHDVDERIQEAFKAAFDDTAREFERVFATLFPGGEGALRLTDPDNLASSGVEVHARPAGKRVTRLSLLSGGERSLAALALLLAIFRARPSPFYILDEVEAALDDLNLTRLLACLDELRATSQLVIVTHQKRTMEIADALYGVSMGADGVSTVISQRLREPATA
ncbi:MAG: AAA family ATPase, partial [Mycobacteriales bacterium]